MQNSAVIIFILLDISVRVLSIVGDPGYYRKCFSDDNSYSCESRSIKIGDDSYGCQKLIAFDNEVVQIGFVDVKGEHLVLVQDSTLESYIIPNESNKKEIADFPRLPSCIALADDEENTYEIKEGKSFVKNKNGIQRDILMGDGFIPIELAKDPVTKQLLILAVKRGPTGVRAGVLFSIGLNPPKRGFAKREPITAKMISPPEVVITGLSIYEGLNDLVLGVKIGKKFNVVKAQKLPSDFCGSRTLEDQIRQVLDAANFQTSEALAQLCTDLLSVNSRTKRSNDEEELKKSAKCLKTYRKELKDTISEFTRKLEEFNRIQTGVNLELDEDSNPIGVGLPKRISKLKPEELNKLLRSYIKDLLERIDRLSNE